MSDMNFITKFEEMRKLADQKITEARAKEEAEIAAMEKEKRMMEERKRMMEEMKRMEELQELN